MVNITIDGKKLQVAEGTSILDAAKEASVNIPHICHLEGLPPEGACGICVVSIKGERTPTRSCARQVTEGMEITTNSPILRKIRRTIVELMLAGHVKGCFTCERNQNCELLKLAFDLGVDTSRLQWKEPNYRIDDTSMSVIRDPNKCILCGRCIRVCREIQTVGVIDFINRGDNTMVTTFLDRGLGNSECVNCGQCIHVCPVGAIKERSNIVDVWLALKNPNKHVVVQEAPAVRASLGEELGMPKGSLVAGKMYAALRRLGFNAVFDTNFSADLTIMEEASELVQRITSNGVLPLITSCCPGWIKFLEHFYPDLIPHVSTCKSPQQMFGALAKTYYARYRSIDPASIVSVSVMPCTAKKFEANRPEMNASGYRDVDYVLTTRELARMIKESSLDFKTIPEEEADSLMGPYSGAGTIFGATGGVMEAALRTGYMLVTGKELEQIDIIPLRGTKGIKTASVQVGNIELKTAVAHGLGNARVLLDEIRAGQSPYHFIEIMACPGGCVGGGGQPIGFDMSVRSARGEALYIEDKSLKIRRSHENPAVQKAYQEFLGKPLSEEAHHLLHTTYAPRICSIIDDDNDFTCARQDITAGVD